IADGVRGAGLLSMAQALAAEGAVPRFIAPRLGTVDSSGGKLPVDATLENSPSVLFDAVIIPADDSSLAALSVLGQVKDFIKDQYRHGKAIGLLAGQYEALARLGLTLPGNEEALAGIVTLGSQPMQAFIDAVAQHRHPSRESDPPRV
ncbi:MAG TPA: catalase HPII, partial [Accumulibacter sp.]|nr:catalase HPII [Accumulibacter sp.]